MRVASVLKGGLSGLFLGLSQIGVHAALKLPAPFGDHMVVQAGQPTPVWGEGNVGENITVAFNDARGTRRVSANATVDDRGRWRLQLPALGSGLTGILVVQTGKGERREFADVIVGE